MRIRLLLTILLVLSFTVAAVSAVHLYFFRSERLYLVDRQIEQAAAALIASDFAIKKIEDHEEADDDLVDLLGRAAINLVVLLRDQDGRILYENENAELLKASLSTQSQWQFIEVENLPVRVLTVPLNRSQRTLQVGLVLNQNLLRWKLISQRAIAYALLILTCVFFISLLLWRALLKPLDRIAEHLRAMAVHLDAGTLPLEASVPRERGSTGEFGRLIDAVSDLSEKIRFNQQATLRWTAQMVHELKTPLTVVRNQLESAHAPDAIREIDSMVELIDEFLDWTLNQAAIGVPAEMHALKLGRVVDDVTRSLQQIHPGRIQVEVDREATVFAKPSHLEQAVRNLVENALKYSPPDQGVKVVVRDKTLTVSDQGAGIPSPVLANRGKPFNRGPEVSDSIPGSGLGLAWVNTISELYRWPLKFETSSAGTTITLECTDPRN